MNPALLVIDVIHDFVDGKFGSKRAQNILPPLKNLLTYSHQENVPVIFISDAHIPNLDNEFEIWGQHAVEGSKGAEIVKEVNPRKEDYRVLKRHYSSFYATGLDDLLRQLNVDTLILTGLVTNICVQHTAADAFFRGYNIIIPQDCVEAATDEVQNTSLRYMEEMYGAEITVSDILMKKLSRRA